MKPTYLSVSRALIALVFVVAGVQKIMDFEKTTGYIDSLGVPLPVIATILVILVEIPIALMFVFCRKRLCMSGSILIAFTILATILAHRNIGEGMNLIMALKNIAIIGGIVAVLSHCECDKCKTGKKCSACNN